MSYKYIQNSSEEKLQKQREIVINKALEIAEGLYNDHVDDVIAYTIYKTVSDNQIFFGLAIANTIFPSCIKVL